MRKLGYAKGTYSSYRRSWKEFRKFQSDFNLPKSIDVQQLCAFAVLLSSRIRSAETIKNYLQGVHAIACLKGKMCPDLTVKPIKQTIKGLRVKLAFTSRQAAPLTPEMLKQMYDRVDHSDPTQVALWAATIVGWWLLLRKSNLVPNTLSDFNSDNQFMRSDFKSHRKLTLVSIRWSKTLRDKEKILKVPLVPANSKICPVKAFDHMVQLIPAKGSNPAFCVPKGRRRVPITYRKLNAFIKSLVEVLGYDPDHYSTHSIRRGGCSFMAECNIRTELIATVGNWKSDCYLRYIDWAMKNRIEAATIMADNV